MKENDDDWWFNLLVKIDRIIKVPGAILLAIITVNMFNFYVSELVNDDIAFILSIIYLIVTPILILKLFKSIE